MMASPLTSTRLDYALSMKRKRRVCVCVLYLEHAFLPYCVIDFKREVAVASEVLNSSIRHLVPQRPNGHALP